MGGMWMCHESSYMGGQDRGPEIKRKLMKVYQLKMINVINNMTTVYGLYCYSLLTFRSFERACPTKVLPFNKLKTSFCTTLNSSPGQITYIKINMKNIHKVFLSFFFPATVLQKY